MTGSDTEPVSPVTVIELLDPTFTLVSRKAVTAAEDELRANPRARSAKLRVAERTSNPPHGSRQPDALEKGGRGTPTALNALLLTFTEAAAECP